MPVTFCASWVTVIISCCDVWNYEYCWSWVACNLEVEAHFKPWFLILFGGWLWLAIPIICLTQTLRQNIVPRNQDVEDHEQVACFRQPNLEFASLLVDSSVYIVAAFPIPFLYPTFIGVDGCFSGSYIENRHAVLCLQSIWHSSFSPRTLLSLSNKNTLL